MLEKLEQLLEIKPLEIKDLGNEAIKRELPNCVVKLYLLIKYEFWS